MLMLTFCVASSAALCEDSKNVVTTTKSKLDQKPAQKPEQTKPSLGLLLFLADLEKSGEEWIGPIDMEDTAAVSEKEKSPTKNKKETNKEQER